MAGPIAVWQRFTVAPGSGPPVLRGLRFALQLHGFGRAALYHAALPARGIVLKGSGLQLLTKLAWKCTGGRHASYFCDLAAEAAVKEIRERRDFSPQTRVELDLDNYRAELEWALTHENDSTLGGAIAAALSGFWWNAGLGVEGRYWIELALERVNEAEHPRIAALLLTASAGFFSGERNYEACERALQLFESVGDVRDTARAKARVAFALFLLGRLDEASVLIAQALEALRVCGDEHELPVWFSVQASIEGDRGDRRLGRELQAQALAAYKALGDEFGQAIVLVNSGELEFTDGQPEQALHCVNGALEILSRGKNADLLATAHGNRAAYCLALRDFMGARESAREALRLAAQAQVDRLATGSLESFALLAVLGGDAQRAARLCGYVDAQKRRLGQERTAAGKVAYGKLIAALRDTLSEDKIKNLAAEGAGWSEDRAVEEALKV